MNISISKEQSVAIKVLVFIATCFVVVRHAHNLHHYYPNGSVFMPVSDVNIFIQEFITKITDCAIPSFFMISGFLFFTGIEKINEIAPKLQRRIHSLLIPFLLWNLLAFVVWKTLSLIPFFYEPIMTKFQFSWSFSWFLTHFSIHPMVGQFWYIRTLMIFCCAAPLLYFIYSFRTFSFLIFGFLIMYWQPVDCTVFSTEGIFWFYFGGLAGFNDFHQKLSCTRLSFCFPVIILFFILLEMYQISFRGFWFIRIAFSVVFLVQFSLFLSTRTFVEEHIATLSKYPFFIYAIHGSVVAASSMLLSNFIPHNSCYSLLAYVTVIFLTFFVAFFIAKIMYKYMNPIFLLLAGGRN